jgi:hypothetical protein
MVREIQNEANHRPSKARPRGKQETIPTRENVHLGDLRQVIGEVMQGIRCEEDKKCIQRAVTPPTHTNITAREKPCS